MGFYSVECRKVTTIEPFEMKNVVVLGSISFWHLFVAKKSIFFCAVFNFYAHCVKKKVFFSCFWMKFWMKSWLRVSMIKKKCMFLRIFMVILINKILIFITNMMKNCIYWSECGYDKWFLSCRRIIHLWSCEKYRLEALYNCWKWIILPYP